METQITCRYPTKSINTKRIRTNLAKILKGLGCHKCELSLLLTDDQEIAELNYRFLRRKGPTNVLAFPMRENESPEPETPMLGDIVVSLDAALRDAKTTGESFQETLDRLLVHGLLHLVGYDHEISEEEGLRMDNETHRLLALMK
jgi:rRNA maturation RNase YbeY